ncbi:MAG: DUF86 domain-containing protein [Betaproteobacteria bacterium]|nr:DUF86 domain-containing protein [Betaproteobacteria bacterium]
MRSTPSEREPKRDPGRALEWIDDILKNIAHVRGFLRGVSVEQFRRSAEKRYAVQYALTAISAAARRLPLELQDRHSAIPWRQVEDLRNMYTHEYHHVDAMMVWKTATGRLAALGKAMTQERRMAATRPAGTKTGPV